MTAEIDGIRERYLTAYRQSFLDGLENTQRCEDLQFLLTEIDRLTTITTLHERDLAEYREAANKGVKGFRAQIEELKTQNTALREENDELKRRVNGK